MILHHCIGALSLSDIHLSVPRHLSHFPSCIDSVCHRSFQGSSEDTSPARHGSTCSLGVHLFATSERSPANSRKDATSSSDAPSDDSSEDRSRAHPPTPPPRRFLRRGGSFRLPCILKQDSHEKPIVQRQDSDSPTDCALMSRIAASLRFAPLPAMAVAGLAPPPDEDLMQTSPKPDRQNNHVPMHRASYHGHSKYIPEMNGMEMQNHLQRHPEERFIGSAENLVGRVLQEQGLGRYCDPEFVKATQRELAEAINMTPEELDRAAHRLLQEQQNPTSNPYLYQPMSSEEDSPYHVPKNGLRPSEGFLLSLQDENRPHSQQNYHGEAQWDNKHFGDTRL